jgi:hypothetical protein
MARKMKTLNSRPPEPVAEPSPWPADVAGALAEAESLLEDGQPAKALERLGRAGRACPWLTNAVGVCQLRLGNGPVAVDLYRGLVLGSGGLILRDDVPPVFKANYAAALLRSGFSENMGVRAR